MKAEGKGEEEKKDEQKGKEYAGAHLWDPRMSVLWRRGLADDVR